MRENIGLYRGKRKDNGEWVQGQLVFVDDAPVIFALDDPDHSAIWAYGEVRLWGCYEVDPETVGQFTGLLDQTGKKIFEGDFIRIRFEGDCEPEATPPVWYETAKVVYSSKYHCWNAVYADGDELSMWEYDNPDDVWVIGSIHDNRKELEECYCAEVHF